MVPQFPNFIDFEKVSFNEYQKFVTEFEPYSDFNFISIFSWSPPGTCRLSMLNNNLVMAIKDYQSEDILLSFLGKNKLYETAVELLDYAKEHQNFETMLKLIPATVAEYIRSKHSNLVIHEDHDNHDYVLSAEQYVTLPGKTFENKRKNINKFVRHYGEATEISVVKLTDPGVRERILSFVERWASWGTEGSVNSRDESSAIARLLDNAESLAKFTKLHCIEVYVDGNFEGFCIFEVLENNFAITHFGKANINLSHMYEYLMMETLRYIFHTFHIDLVNNEQDLGISGLRHSKLAQHPIKFLKKYTIKYSDDNKQVSN